MLPSGDQLVSRLSGGSVSPVAPAPALPPGVPAGTGEADAGAPGLYGGYEAGFQAGQQAFERWAAAGGANRLMGESCIFKSMLAYGGWESRVEGKKRERRERTGHIHKRASRARVP